MRKLSKTLAMMGLLTPVGANALGVGEIKLHSALNQSLKADIPLITSASDSVSEVRVNLASPSAFAKAGLERPFYLSGLKFKTINKGGRVYVRVTSRDVIREPFLNFLVDVSWPQGRMLREFTVLLDPPVTVNKKSVTAHSAPIVKSTTVTQPLYKVDDASNYGFRARPAVNPKPATKSNYNSGDYVEVEKNDTLWGIAKRVNRSGSVSDEQMIVALYESNPRAFFKKNMNALKAGARLKIPQQEMLASSTKRQAIGEIKAQYDAWTGEVADRSQLNSEKSAATSPVDSAKQPRSQLKLVAPSDKSGVADKAVGSAPGDRSNKAEVAIEMAETVSQENEELRSRLQQVEEQLAMMQRLIALKDKQLSTLQAKSGGDVADEQLIASQKVMDVAAGDKSIEPTSVSTPTDQNAVAAVDNQIAKPEVETDQITEKDPILAETDGEKAMENSVVSGDSKTIENKVSDNTVPPVAKPAVQKPKPQPAVQEDDLLSEIFAEPMYLALGGGGIVLLGIFAWMLSRRKISADQLETESVLGESVDDDKTEVASANANTEAEQSSSVADISTVAESSFLSEFTPSDFDALETEHDEVDPVSEADVYLAYGRYQQAEDLIRSAIENYPDRDECKLKLFEIHYATEDKAAFEAYAEELSSMKNDNPDFWSKVVEMGRELCPQNPVFGGTGSNALDQSDNDVSFDGVEPDELAPQAESIETPQEALDGQDEFSTSQTDEIDLGTDLGLGSSAVDDDGMDFGLDTTDDLDENTVMEDAQDDADKTEIPLEFGVSDSSDEDVFAESTDGSAMEGQADDNDLEFGGGIDLSMDEEPVQSVENDDNTLEFDLDFTSSSTEGDVDSDMGSVSDFADSDEIETKLDLAKAYVEMDDQDSARDILTEILAEGNDEQKTEAQALVDVIENKA